MTASVLVCEYVKHGTTCAPSGFKGVLLLWLSPVTGAVAAILGYLIGLTRR
jgi:hypothetical protein